MHSLSTLFVRRLSLLGVTAAIGISAAPAHAGSVSSTAADNAAGGGTGQGQLMSATQQMQETQMSFNLQYLQLENEMFQPAAPLSYVG
jgi:hypothetical protein